MGIYELFWRFGSADVLFACGTIGSITIRIHGVHLQFDRIEPACACSLTTAAKIHYDQQRGKTKFTMWCTATATIDSHPHNIVVFTVRCRFAPRAHRSSRTEQQKHISCYLAVQVLCIQYTTIATIPIVYIYSRTECMLCVENSRSNCVWKTVFGGVSTTMILPQHCSHFSNRLCSVRFAFGHRAMRHGIRRVSRLHR